MPKKKHAKNPLLATFSLLGQILIVIGTPVLVALKLLFYFSESIGNKVLSFGEKPVKKVRSQKKSLPKVEKPDFPNWFLDQKTKAFITFKALQVKIHERNKIALFSLKSTPKKKHRLSFTEKQKRSLPTFILPTITFPKIVIPKVVFLKFPKTPRLVGATIAGVSATIVVFTVVYFAVFVINGLPNPKLLAQKPLPLTTKIYDRNDILLYQFYGNENRSLVDLAELPPYVPQAIIAAEDKNFYYHIGFDPSGITRAALANYSGESAQGGSTITQQLVKFSLLSSERTITRKLRELVLSMWTERTYTKDQILTMYINYIGFGGPAYGIEAASEIYFGKPAKNLTLSEAALLASLPSSPTTYSPFGEHPEIAKYRQMQVLDKMYEQGYITKSQAEKAKFDQLTFVPNETEIKAPHFVMYVKDELIKRFGEKQVLEGGLRVKTTLDYPLYKKVTDELKAGVEKQQYLNVQNGAVLVTNPKTGEILSMSGSTDFFNLSKDGNVNVTVAERSPGSSIKPLTYALGFEMGTMTPNTIFEDKPSEFRQVGGPPYRPINYDNRFHGRVTARTALGSSYNIPAVKVLEKVGLINFLQFAQNAGLSTLNDPNRYGLAITLGGGEVKMVDMAKAYSMFPNQGTTTPLTSILEVKSQGGDLIPDLIKEEPKHLISGKTAFYINSILSDDDARAPTFGRGSILNIPGHTVAVKTGTAETKRDNWTIGYSFGDNPRLVAVWVGNNDNSPMSPALESGNTGAATVWNPVMKLVLEGSQDRPVPKPNNLIPVQICGTTEYFVQGTEPKEPCNLKPLPSPTQQP